MTAPRPIAPRSSRATARPQATRPATDRDGIARFLSALSAPSDEKLAVFLGAGSSKAFGYPLTHELLPRITKKLAAGKILHGGRARRELLEFLDALLPGTRDGGVAPSVTSVLSLLDYSLATGQGILPERGLEDTRRARALLERALLEAIPDAYDFEPHERRHFERFERLLRCSMKSRPRNSVGLITSNYDMVADLAACRAAGVKGRQAKWSFRDLARKVDYGFRWLRADVPEERLVPRPDKPKLSVLKLHGATNWLRCPLCDNLYVNPNGPIAWDAYDDANKADNECHCSATRLVPQVVSPSFVRDIREPNLAEVWKAALDLLRAADHWVIIGYSFPDEDVGIRALFTRSFGSRKKRPRISVIQPDERVLANYESFFPAKSVEYLVAPFEDILVHVP